MVIVKLGLLIATLSLLTLPIVAYGLEITSTTSSPANEEPASLSTPSNVG